MYPKHCKQIFIIITKIVPKHSMDGLSKHTSLSLVCGTDIDEVALHEFEFIVLLRSVGEQDLVCLERNWGE